MKTIEELGEELKDLADDISLAASRVYEAPSADDLYDAKLDLERALKALDAWRTSLAE